MRSLLIITILFLAACGTKPTTTVCTPGQQVSCACPEGAKGVQVCKSDGSGLGTCKCPVGSPWPDMLGVEPDDMTPDPGEAVDMAEGEDLTVVEDLTVRKDLEKLPQPDLATPQCENVWGSTPCGWNGPNQDTDMVCTALNAPCATCKVPDVTPCLSDFPVVVHGMETLVTGLCVDSCDECTLACH